MFLFTELAEISYSISVWPGVDIKIKSLNTATPAVTFWVCVPIKELFDDLGFIEIFQVLSKIIIFSSLSTIARYRGVERD